MLVTEEFNWSFILTPSYLVLLSYKCVQMCMQHIDSVNNYGGCSVSHLVKFSSAEPTFFHSECISPLLMTDFFF